MNTDKFTALHLFNTLVQLWKGTTPPTNLASIKVYMDTPMGIREVKAVYVENDLYKEVDGGAIAEHNQPCIILDFEEDK